jgi:hypothetical protein
MWSANDMQEAPMSLGTLTLWLHITTMFTAIAISFGPALLVELAYRSDRVAPVREMALLAVPIGRVIPILFVLGGLLGLVTAINFGYNLLAPWLLIAYVLFASVLITGVAYNRTLAPRIVHATADVPDGPLTPQIAAIFTDPRYRFVTTLDVVVVIAILFDMVVKPFS